MSAYRAGVTALVVAAMVAVASGCYRLERPPSLGETVRVTVVANDARLVRAQAALQEQVARAVVDRLGWRVSPTGTARLDLSLREERIASTGTDEHDIPVRWSITLHGHALLTSLHGTDLGDFAGTGYASGLADEPRAIEDAARNAAAELASWLITAGERWGAKHPPAVEPPVPLGDQRTIDERAPGTDAPQREGEGAVDRSR